MTRFTLGVTGFTEAPGRPEATHAFLPQSREPGPRNPGRPPAQGRGCLPALPRSAGPEGREGRGEKERGGGGSPYAQYPPLLERRPGSPAAPGAVLRGGSWRRGGPSPNMEMPTPLGGQAPAWKETEVPSSPSLAPTSPPTPRRNPE